MGFFDRFRKSAPASPARPAEDVPGAEAALDAPQRPPAGGKPSSFLLGCAADVGSGPLPVFPLFMPESWQRAPTQVCRPLIGGVALRDIPVVALTYLIPAPGSATPQRGFIRKERVDQLGKTVRDFEAEALHNVAVRPASWSRMERGDFVIAGCSDDYLAAERILDPAFLREAHDMVSDRSLLVGIPARGQLHAVSLSRAMAQPQLALVFKTIVEKMFQDAGELGITPWPFIVNDGRINSVAELQ